MAKMTVTTGQVRAQWAVGQTGAGPASASRPWQGHGTADGALKLLLLLLE